MDNRGRSRSPFRANLSERSRSPYRSGRDAHNNNRYVRRMNPNVHDKRVYWECGSPDHILSDRKCTPKLETIKINITEHVQTNSFAIDGLAKQFMTLHTRASKGSIDNVKVPVHSDNESTTYTLTSLFSTSKNVLR